MPAGLQLFNASGALLLDTSDRLGRIVGAVQLKGFNGQMSADLSSGTPFWSFQPDFLFAHTTQQTPPPIITIDSNGVSWMYSSTSGLNYAKPITGWLFYGVF